MLDSELRRFRADHPRCAALHERARGSLFGGVPMPWMMLWAGGYPIAVAEASGSRVRCVDGIEFVRMGSEDVVRHKLVQRIVAAYNEYAEKQAPELRPARRQRP